MALRWLEGFEDGNTGTIYDRLYTMASAATTFNDDDGAILDGDRAVASDDNVMTTPVLVGTTQNSWIIGFAFRPDDSQEIDDGSNFAYVGLENTDGEQIRIEFIDSVPTSSKPGGLYYKLRIMRGATEIATSDQAFPIGASDELWIYFEFKVTIDNASGSVEGRYRHTRKPSVGSGFTTLTWDASVSSIDTQNQTSTGADRFTLSFDTGSANDTVCFDDLYVCDSTGTKNNDYLGMVLVVAQTCPDGAGGEGDTTDWTLVTATSTGDAIQEPATAVEDDKRLTSDTTAQIHFGDYDALPSDAGDGTIVGIRKDLHGKMETTGSLSIGHMWRKTTATAGQTESGTALAVSSTTTVANSVVLEDDPNTATDWVRADVDTYQYGFKNNG